MLATARRVTAGGPAIDWKQADATALTFPTGSFDVVFCQQGLQFVADRDQAAREMRRVLAPGGRAAVAVWCDIEENLAFGRFAAALARHSAPAGTMMRSPFGFGGRDSLRAVLADAGFGQVRIVRHGRVCRFASPAELLRSETVASPMSEPLGQLDEGAAQALLADVEETMAPYVDDDGLTMPMEALLALAVVDHEPAPSDR
jgi:SAM-dependent methyltransferase